MFFICCWFWAKQSKIQMFSKFALWKVKKKHQTNRSVSNAFAIHGFLHVLIALLVEYVAAATFCLSLGVFACCFWWNLEKFLSFLFKFVLFEIVLSEIVLLLWLWLSVIESDFVCFALRQLCGCRFLEGSWLFGQWIGRCY